VPAGLRRSTARTELRISPKITLAGILIGPQSFLPAVLDLLYGDDLEDCPVAALNSVPVGELTHDLDCLSWSF